MKAEQHSEDSALKGLLRTWKPDSPLPPGFQEQVWQRIDKASGSAAPRLRLKDWLAQIFERPAMAFSYVAVLLVAGVTIGFWQGHTSSERTAAELSARYVQLMNSFAAPH